MRRRIHFDTGNFSRLAEAVTRAAVLVDAVTRERKGVGADNERREAVGERGTARDRDGVAGAQRGGEVTGVRAFDADDFHAWLQRFHRD